MMPGRTGPAQGELPPPAPTPTRRSAARLAARAALCLALGAFLTTAVAAACLMYAPTTGLGLPNGFSNNDAQGREPGTAFFKTGEAYVGLGVRDEINYWLWVVEGPSDTGLVGAGVGRLYAGWPSYAFTTPPLKFDTARDFQQFQAATDHAYTLLTTKHLPAFLNAKPHRLLPTRPLPLAFAANTLVYAALAGALIYGPGIARRALRRRAGRCTACGYPLPGGPRCPECGALAPAPAAATVHRLLSPEVAL